MAVIITDLLGTDSISGSRSVINTNFQACKDMLDDIETNFGISIVNGNIDVSLAIGGEIKAKTIAVDNLQLAAAGVATISLTGSTGTIAGVIGTFSTSLTSVLTTTTNLVTLNTGSSLFAGPVAVTSLTELRNGAAIGIAVDIGTTTTHTVLNSDCQMIFDCASTLTLTPDASLVDGHVIVLIKKGTASATVATASILGGATITFSTSAYYSSVMLSYNSASSKWIMIGNNNATIS